MHIWTSSWNSSHKRFKVFVFKNLCLWMLLTWNSSITTSMARAGSGNFSVDGNFLLFFWAWDCSWITWWWLRALCWSADHCSAGGRFRMVREAGGMYCGCDSNGPFSWDFFITVIYLPNFYGGTFVFAEIYLMCFLTGLGAFYCWILSSHLAVNLCLLLEMSCWGKIA